jgi:Family of unknown function (DUF6113)
MGTPQGLRRGGQPRAYTVVTYLVLFLLGLVQGLIGSFQYSRSPAPFIAILLVVVIFVTCLLCGWGMQSIAGGLFPAIGWIAASFVLSMPSSHGSVIITATTAGEWYLYGGAFAAVGGASMAFILWARRYPRRR